MKIMVMTGSPNKDGLTAACGEEARQGAAGTGAEVYLVNLNDLAVGMCHACGNGWGTCLERHECQVKDDFQPLHARMKEMDGFVIVTPVYWGDLSESTKAFLDRVRRSEARKNQDSFLAGKPVIAVAAAGGSGNGCMTCLGALERFVDHVKGVKFDFIAVTQRSRSYQLGTIHAAAKAMAESLLQKS